MLTMFIKVKRALILIGLFLFSIAIVTLTIYGGIQLCTRPERIEITEKVESQRIKIKNYELKIRELRRLNDFVPAMEQIFTPMILDELKLLSERIRQQSQREYERYEQPLITEEERKWKRVKKSLKENWIGRAFRWNL